MATKSIDKKKTNHQTGMKWGRLINIKRKKTCNRKEIQ